MSYCRSAVAVMLVMILMGPVTTLADDGEVAALRERWETITTDMPDDARGQAYAELVEEATQLVESSPDDADALLWKGIALASEARAKGGPGALGLAKEARDDLERVVELDPSGGNASAYVTLAVLYQRVPGWPLGFGDSDTAEALFQSARQIRPEGIDVNYYYAVFLAEEGRVDDALEHARLAVEGEPREGRTASDEALRDDAWKLIDRLSS